MKERKYPENEKNFIEFIKFSGLGEWSKPARC